MLTGPSNLNAKDESASRHQKRKKRKKKKYNLGTFKHTNLETNKLLYESHCPVTLTETNKPAILFCDPVSQSNPSHFFPETPTSSGRFGFLVTPPWDTMIMQPYSGSSYLSVAYS